MELNEKNVEPMCPIIDIDGYIANGKQYDLDITLANDNRDVIYGIVRDCFKDPVKDAVVKLVEVDYNCGKKELKPVTHTFTDSDGEFVFGPLCPGKKYSVQVAGFIYLLFILGVLMTYYILFPISFNLSSG